MKNKSEQSPESANVSNLDSDYITPPTTTPEEVGSASQNNNEAQNRPTDNNSSIKRSTRTMGR